MIAGQTAPRTDGVNRGVSHLKMHWPGGRSCVAELARSSWLACAEAFWRRAECGVLLAREIAAPGRLFSTPNRLDRARLKRQSLAGLNFYPCCQVSS
jgi:hypothetical protein